MSELYHPRHLSPVLWSIAGIVAIALHAGGVGLAFVSKQADSEPDLGAPAIEIGIELQARTERSTGNIARMTNNF